jgi:dolichol-phosphate mannosyltransferase
MKISVVFSFRNECSNLKELVTRTVGALRNINDSCFELIFVNDDSTDNSEEILLELQKKFPIIIINMSRRFGVTPCVIAGLSQSSGDVAIYLDSDLQDPPELIPELISKYQLGYDVVHTTRISRDGEKWIKLFLTKIAYHIINRFSDINLPTNTGDYKLLSRRVINEILNLKEYDPYMRGLSIWVGFKQYFFYYKREARFAGEAKFSLLSKGPISEFFRGLTSYSAIPLYISFVMGIFVTFISFLVIIWALICKYLGISYPGSTGVLVAVSFFSGVILTTNGIMGLYISKMYYELKGRPRYIIKNIRDYL